MKLGVFPISYLYSYGWEIARHDQFVMARYFQYNTSVYLEKGKRRLNTKVNLANQISILQVCKFGYTAEMGVVIGF